MFTPNLRCECAQPGLIDIMRKWSISPLTPGSPGSDLNPVIRTDCMCSVKCAEAAWNYKSGRHSAL